MYTEQTIIQKLQFEIAKIDNKISDLLNQILHHPNFQALESQWRGLEYLLTDAPQQKNVKIRVLDINWPEIARDIEKAIEL